MKYSEKIDKYLKEYFGYDEFRLEQKEVIESILGGRHTIAIFPTGGGKSICFQIPALILQGTTIVISPLISLMKDQVDELVELNIPATFISSILSDQEVEKRIEEMRLGFYKIVYIAPERFYSEAFLEALEEIHIPFIAIDEAHCISQWGHNFRPAYLKIKDLINHVKGDPVVAAFTATANRKVQQDIQRLLGLGEYCLFVSSFDRPNLEFQIKDCHDKDIYILKYVGAHSKQAGIIYAATRKNVEQVFHLLRSRGIAAGMYHAGMSSEARNRTQEGFLDGTIKVMVATNAFGMGINKSDVRYIIHYNMPKSIENYYQEAGRAGRDGDKAYCILLFSEGDYRLNRFIIEGNYPPVKLVERLYNRIKRRASKGIPQELLLKSRTVDRYTLQSALRKLVEYNYVENRGGVIFTISDGKLELTQEEINRHQEVEVAKLKEIQEYCQGDVCLRRYILKYFNEITNFETCNNCSVCNNKAPKPSDEENLDKLLKGIFDMAENPGAIDHEPVGSELDVDENLYERLRNIRRRISEEVGELEYALFNDDILREIAAIKPVTQKQLLNIQDIGVVQVESFGQEFLKEIHRYLKRGG